MAASVLVDAGFLVALLNRRDGNHRWAVAKGTQYPPPWLTCEAALSEVFYLMGVNRSTSVTGLIFRGAVVSAFRFGEHATATLRLMEKYADVPMSFADACLVRMSETLNDPVLLTTDADFRVYRRHGRQAIPHLMPS